MSRIDVQTLILAFEKKIAELNKNPPELVSEITIKLMLENAIEEQIKEHFKEVIKIDVKSALSLEFHKTKVKLTNNILKNILSDASFQQQLEADIKDLILNGIQ